MEEKNKNNKHIYIYKRKKNLKKKKTLKYLIALTEKKSKRRSIRVSWYQLPDRCDLLLVVAQQFH
jgi:hypothetical protein